MLSVLIMSGIFSFASPFFPVSNGANLILSSYIFVVPNLLIIPCYQLCLSTSVHVMVFPLLSHLHPPTCFHHWCSPPTLLKTDIFPCVTSGVLQFYQLQTLFALEFSSLNLGYYSVLYCTSAHPFPLPPNHICIHFLC